MDTVFRPRRRGLSGPQGGREGLSTPCTTKKTLFVSKTLLLSPAIAARGGSRRPAGGTCAPLLVCIAANGQKLKKIFSGGSVRAAVRPHPSPSSTPRDTQGPTCHGPFPSPLSQCPNPQRHLPHHPLTPHLMRGPERGTLERPPHPERQRARRPLPVPGWSRRGNARTRRPAVGDAEGERRRER